MGEGATKSWQLHHEVLVHIIKEQGYRRNPQKLTLLLFWICHNCFWFPEFGTYELTEWNRVGEALQEAQCTSNYFSPDTLLTWHILVLAPTTLIAVLRV